MPKEKRKRSNAHEKSAKLSKRQFSVQDNAVKHVDVGAQADASGAEILQSITEQEEPRISLKKKEKQAIKHELFIRQLEAARSPYSKSHERRLKRKAKQEIAGGFNELKAAIAAVDDGASQSAEQSSEQDRADGRTSRGQAQAKAGQIGEGKGAPLSKYQRKRALQLERLRIPMILSTPEFTSNPFQTIRTHAQNTLLQHEPGHST